MIELRTHGAVTELHMRTWRSRVTGYTVSAFIVDEILVDTGFAHVGGELEEVLADFPLRGVFLTHGHEDHAGNVARLAARGVPVWISDGSREELAHASTMRLYRRFAWGVPEPLAASVRALDLAPLQAIHTPGHCDDHHVLWDPQRRFLFCGDLFLGVRVRLAHHHERPRALIRSLRAVAALEPARLFDAHRGAVDDAAAMLRAKADWMEELVGRIQSLIDAGWSTDAITREVLGTEPLERWVSGGEYSRRRLVEAVRRESA